MIMSEFSVRRSHAWPLAALVPLEALFLFLEFAVHGREAPIHPHVEDVLPRGTVLPVLKSRELDRFLLIRTTCERSARSEAGGPKWIQMKCIYT
ncbi:hypothetical protein K439DRAFT_1638993, partial [Ramaria rubella]